MCRLYGFRANEPTKVECTLAYAQNALMIQSRSDRRGVAHAEGWGIAWYADGADPVVERRDTAAFSDVHFSHTAERVYATAVVAHVRKATVGVPAPENTHPFVHGPWTFAHNGTVRAFDRVGPRLTAGTPRHLRSLRRGDTDSEAVFLWLLGRMERAGISVIGEAPKAAALGAVVRGCVRVLAEWCAEVSVRTDDPADKPPRLNFVLTNGSVMVATRWRNSLYRLDRDGVHDCEICGIPHVQHDRGVPYRAVLVASEPITSEAWSEVPEASVIAVDPDLRVTVDSIGAPVHRQ